MNQFFEEQSLKKGDELDQKLFSMQSKEIMKMIVHKNMNATSEKNNSIVWPAWAKLAKNPDTVSPLY